MNPQNQTMPDNSQLPPISGQNGPSQPAVNNPVPVARQSTNPMPQQANHNPEASLPSAPQTSKSPHAPTIADDNDLIEKEWVNKAKLIVAKTKDDPREQSKELYKYKADYIKKRYNKDIKVSEA